MRLHRDANRRWQGERRQRTPLGSFRAPSGGDTPDGLDWDEFLEHHRQVLEEQGREGRRLVTAIPVTYQQGKLGGVLLYFSAPVEGTPG